MASHLLLAVLAGAGDERLVLTRLILLARKRSVALFGASVLARLPDLSAGLRAVRTGNTHVFTLTRLVAWFLAFMSAALEILPTRQTAPRLLEPTRLVLEALLAANTRPFHQEGALRAGRLVGVALVVNGLMATCTRSRAGKTALGRSSPARLWGLKDGSPAGAADLVEDGLWTRHACSPVAELLTGMLAAFQLAAADLQADMLRLVVFVGAPFMLPPLGRLPLARTAALSALVPAAIQLSPADAEANWVHDRPLMARRSSRSPSTPAVDVNRLGARCASTGVAGILAWMTASQKLITWLVAMGDRVLTRWSWLHGH